VRERCPAPAARRATDDFGDTLLVRDAPRRIVSLNPSTTELLFAIGAGAARRSDDVRSLARGRARGPDLGPGCAQRRSVCSPRAPISCCSTRATTIATRRARLRAAGVATAAYRVDRIADFRARHARSRRAHGDTTAARATVDSVARRSRRVRAATSALPRPTVFWPLYDQPLLATGGGSFSNELIDVAGGSNVYGFMPQPSPRITVEDLLKRDPEIILLSPESRARYVADPRWRALRAVRGNRLLAVDTTLVYRPASLGEAARSLARLLHPGAVK
jgi:iron complex transport system substrate-binding protein